MMSPTNALLARYLAGECSADEEREIARWADEDAAHQALLDNLETVWRARRPSPSWDVPEMWAEVRRSMGAERRAPVAEGPLFGHGRASFGTRRLFGVVAAAAAAVLLIVGGKYLTSRQAERRAAVPGLMREYATARGQRAKLQLPDGTRLVLGPESRVRYPLEFGHVTREVWIDGEALFDVVHDPARPFRAHAKYAVAQDIGTRFDVRAYAEDSVVTVMVAEGAVALGVADKASAGVAQGVVLGAGELGTLGRVGQVTTARGRDTSDYLAWADGRLAFTDASLAQVAVRIGRWYGVDVQLASPALATRRVTAAFRGESVTEALQFVASFLNLTVTQVGNRYTLQSK